MIIAFVCCACGRRYSCSRPASEMVEELQLADPDVSMADLAVMAAEAQRGEGLVCDACFLGVEDLGYATVH